jgi:anti-anti-sigma factor
MRIVEFVTSSVLGKLITLHRRLHRHDGKMVICNLWGEVESVMETSKLDMYFNLTPDVESAVVMLND